MSNHNKRYSQRAAFHNQGISSSNDVNQHQTSDYYQRNATQDDQRMNKLQSRVSILKEISINIGEEVRSQNQYMERMENDFGNTQNILSNTMRRFYQMASTQNGSYIIYMCLFIVFVFLILYSGIYRFF